MTPPALHRPIILTFTRHYLPGFRSGGPLRTIANMVEALSGEFEFRIVTSDRDATDTEPYPGIAEDGRWMEVGKAKVIYLSPAQRTLGRIAAILRNTPHDIVYLNSFFDPVFTQRPLLARRLRLARAAPCVIAPRGEFSLGALSLRPVRKAAFIAAARTVGLYHGLQWQASSEHEEADIWRTMGHHAERITVALDLPDMSLHPPPPFEARRPGEPLRLCFLSRVSPMKNLDYVLEVLRDVQTPVHLAIYGPIVDPDYWERCRALIAVLPEHVAVAQHGAVDHASVLPTLAAHDLFFLPSRGENYGHVILEALSAGLPVLISDRTPWRDLSLAGIGWDLPLDKPQDFAAKICEVAQLPLAEQLQIRARAFSFAQQRKVDTDAVVANRRLFSRCL